MPVAVSVPQAADKESPLLAEYYDLEYQDFTEDLTLYLGFAERCGSPILELGCGSGRILAYLAGKGFYVTGIDKSPDMLALARKRIEREGTEGRVQLLQGDIADFAAGQKFQLAFAAVNTFLQLTDQEKQLATLRCVLDHLEKSGVLILDVFNPERALWEQGPMLERQFEDPLTGDIILKLISGQVDRTRQLQHLTLMYDHIDEQGRVSRTVSHLALRYIYRYEMELLLEISGFRVGQVYGSYDMDPLTDASDSMIFVASKQG